MTTTDKLDGTRDHKFENTKDVVDTVVKADLSFTLTESDFAEKGKEAGRTAAELRALEEEFDELKKEWKERIESKEDELGLIHATIRAGKETRFVKCIERKDFNSNRVTHIFNGEVMAERVMGLDERQLLLLKTQETETAAQ